MRKSASAAVVVILLASWAATLGGCRGYRLGSTLPPGVRTVHVPTFVNRTREPLLEAEATQAAIREFQRDGTLRVTGAREADLVLEAALVDYRLEPLRFQPDRARTTREYRLRLFADVTVRRAGVEAPLLTRRVQGESTFEPAGDLSSAKRGALPQAARDLAHDIVESVVEYW
jgi:hypothetical protein